MYFEGKRRKTCVPGEGLEGKGGGGGEGGVRGRVEGLYLAFRLWFCSTGLLVQNH